MSLPAIQEDEFGYISPKANAILELSPTLAAELAAGLTTPSEIFGRHNIDEHSAKALLKNKQFVQMLKAAKAEWEGDSNAEERIRMKAKLALEELLLPQYQMAQHPNTPPASRNEATKIFKSLSGMDNKEAGGAGVGERFVVNINLGEKPIVIDGGTGVSETTDL